MKYCLRKLADNDMTYFKLRHTVLTSIKQVKDNYLLIFDGFSDRNGG